MEFDKEFEKLKDISKDLDREDLSLDESIKKYTEACAIIESCVDELKNAKGKVLVLREKIENMIEENFE